MLEEGGGDDGELALGRGMGTEGEVRGLSRWWRITSMRWGEIVLEPESWKLMVLRERVLVEGSP